MADPEGVQGVHFNPLSRAPFFLWKPFSVFQYKMKYFVVIKKRIHYLCEDWIEKSTPRDHHLSSLGKSRDANRWFSVQVFYPILTLMVAHRKRLRRLWYRYPFSKQLCSPNVFLLLKSLTLEHTLVKRVICVQILEINYFKIGIIDAVIINARHVQIVFKVCRFSLFWKGPFFKILYMVQHCIRRLWPLSLQ